MENFFILSPIFWPIIFITLYVFENRIEYLYAFVFMAIMIVFTTLIKYWGQVNKFSWAKRPDNGCCSHFCLVDGQGNKPKNNPTQTIDNFIDDRNTDATFRGMPSGHAASVWFFVSFMILSIRKRNFSMTRKNIIAGILLLIGLGVTIHRHTLKCHTIVQLIIGSLIGIGFAYGAWYLWQTKVKRWADSIERKTN